jgi:hypothetical protein
LHGTEILGEIVYLNHERSLLGPAGICSPLRVPIEILRSHPAGRFASRKSRDRIIYCANEGGARGKNVYDNSLNVSDGQKTEGHDDAIARLDR